MNRNSTRGKSIVSLLFGLMLMPQPVIPEFEHLGLSEAPPESTLFARGNADFCRNEYTLRYEPFRGWNSTTCRQTVVGDADGDGFWDMAELELLWAFFPYLIFDNDEGFLRKLVLVYQATPYSPLESRMPTSEAGETAYLRIKIILLFEGDVSSCSYVFAEHGGDTESFTLLLEGRRDVQTGELRHWKLIGASDYHGGKKIENMESLYVTHCESIVNPSGGNQSALDEVYKHFYRNPQMNPAQGLPDIDSGLLHPKAFISKNKHGLYPSLQECNDTWHGGCPEQCQGGGQEFLMPPGMQWLDGVGSLQEEFVSNIEATQAGMEPPGFLVIVNLGEKTPLLIDDLG